MTSREVCWWPMPGRVGICGERACETVDGFSGGRRVCVHVCAKHVAAARREIGGAE